MGREGREWGGNALTQRVLLQGSVKDRLGIALEIGEAENCGKRVGPCEQLA